MVKTKQEKIASIQEQIQQLKNQEKQLLLTDEHFKTFLEKTVLTDQSRRILDGLTAQNAAVAAPIRTSAAAQSAATPTAKPSDVGRVLRTLFLLQAKTYLSAC